MSGLLEFNRGGQSSIGTGGANFAKSMKEWVHAVTEKRLPSVVRDATRRLFIAIVKDSPVDTGRFVVHWVVSTEKDPRTIQDFRLDGRKVSTGKYTKETRDGNFPGGRDRYSQGWTTGSPKQTKIAEIDAFFRAHKLAGFPSFYLTNSLPYARRLEYGYSSQAPSGMVRKNTDKFDKFVEEAIAASRYAGVL